VAGPAQSKTLKLMTAPPEAVDRGTLTFLEDSIVLAMRSEVEPDSEVIGALARGSILATAMFVEGCANTCLDMLALDRQFATDVDRLPMLSKFELFIRLYRPRAKFERSRHEVQGLVELKKVRDSFVHPKGQAIIWESWSPEASSSRSPRTKLTDLPKIASYSYEEDAVRAMKAAHAFLKYFFSRVCAFRPSHVGALLLSEDRVPNPKEKNAPYWERHRHVWLKSKNIDLAYIRIGKL
jgi:hypothetical protein